jgi:hypothetical protein
VEDASFNCVVNLLDEINPEWRLRLKDSSRTVIGAVLDEISALVNSQRKLIELQEFVDKLKN